MTTTIQKISKGSLVNNVFAILENRKEKLAIFHEGKGTAEEIAITLKDNPNCRPLSKQEAKELPKDYLLSILDGRI